MLKRSEQRAAQARAAEMLVCAGIVITTEEQEDMEIAEFNF